MTKEPQHPAEGISATKAANPSVTMLTIPCRCHQDAHNHEVIVEPSDDGADVTIYTRTTTRYWDKEVNVCTPQNRCTRAIIGLANSLAMRIKYTYQIWVRGYVESEVQLSMTKQQATNYAAALQQALDKTHDHGHSSS